MVYNYVVILKKTKDKYIDMLNLLLCVLTILALAFAQVQAQKKSYLLWFSAFCLLAVLVWNIYMSVYRRKIVRYNSCLFISGMIWITMPFLTYISIVFFFLSFLEYQVKRPLEVGFTPQQVVINSLFKRKYQWDEFSNVVLKDGLLTLDFKNNRLFQKESIDEDDPEADEDEFNDFCRKQLAGAGSPALN